MVNGNDLLITNLTGHPSVVFPVGYREAAGIKTPVSALITGHLNDDDRLLAFARAYQHRVTAHLERPPLDEMMSKKTAEEAAKEAAGEEKPSDQPPTPDPGN